MENISLWNYNYSELVHIYNITAEAPILIKPINFSKVGQ